MITDRRRTIRRTPATYTVWLNGCLYTWMTVFPLIDSDGWVDVGWMSHV